MTNPNGIKPPEDLERTWPHPEGSHLSTYEQNTWAPLQSFTQTLSQKISMQDSKWDPPPEVEILIWVEMQWTQCMLMSICHSRNTGILPQVTYTLLLCHLMNKFHLAATRKNILDSNTLAALLDIEIMQQDPNQTKTSTISQGSNSRNASRLESSGKDCLSLFRSLSPAIAWPQAQLVFHCLDASRELQQTPAFSLQKLWPFCLWQGCSMIRLLRPDSPAREGRQIHLQFLPHLLLAKLEGATKDWW